MVKRIINLQLCLLKLRAVVPHVSERCDKQWWKASLRTCVPLAQGWPSGVSCFYAWIHIQLLVLGSEKCWCLICSLMLWNLTGLLVFLELDELRMSNWHRVHETDLDAWVYSHSIHINMAIVTNHNLEAWQTERFKCCQYNLYEGSQWEKFTKMSCPTKAYTRQIQSKPTRDKYMFWFSLFPGSTSSSLCNYVPWSSAWQLWVYNKCIDLMLLTLVLYNFSLALVSCVWAALTGFNCNSLTRK